MKDLNEFALSDATGGGDLPIASGYYGPNLAEIAALLALLTHPITQHMSD